MRAVCLAIGVLGASCALDTDDVTDEEVGTDESAVSWCASGWHEHYVTWPEVGRRNYPCGPVTSVIRQGRHVCMASTGSHVCQGQGYAQVYLLETEGPGSWTWARTEAFNGH